MRDVILAQLAAPRAVLLDPKPSAAAKAAALASLDAAVALVGAWGNLDPEPTTEPADGMICRHERRTSAATHGNPGAWMCLDCGFNGTDSAPGRGA